MYLVEVNIMLDNLSYTTACFPVSFINFSYRKMHSKSCRTFPNISRVRVEIFTHSVSTFKALSLVLFGLVL